MYFGGDIAYQERCRRDTIRHQSEFLILNVTGLDVVERDLFCIGTWGRTLFAHIFLSRRVSMGGGCEGEGEKRDLPPSPRNLIPSC